MDQNSACFVNRPKTVMEKCECMRKFEDPPVHSECKLHPGCTCLETQDINFVCCNSQNSIEEYRLKYVRREKSTQTRDDANDAVADKSTQTDDANGIIMIPARMKLIRADGRIWYETMPLLKCESCTSKFQEIVGTNKAKADS